MPFTAAAALGLRKCCGMEGFWGSLFLKQHSCFALKQHWGTTNSSLNHPSSLNRRSLNRGVSVGRWKSRDRADVGTAGTHPEHRNSSNKTGAKRMQESIESKGLPAEGWVQAAHHACLAACSCHLSRVCDVNAKHLDWRHLQADKGGQLDIDVYVQ